MANWVAQGGGRSRVLGYYPSTSLEECFPPFFFPHEGIPKIFFYISRRTTTCVNEDEVKKELRNERRFLQYFHLPQ